MLSIHCFTSYLLDQGLSGNLFVLNLQILLGVDKGDTITNWTLIFVYDVGGNKGIKRLYDQIRGSQTFCNRRGPGPF